MVPNQYSQVILSAGVQRLHTRGLILRACALLCAATLKARKINEPTNVSGISQSEVPLCRYKVDLSLIPNGNHPTLMLRAEVIDTITGDLPSFHLKGVRDKPFLQGLDLADSNFDKPASINMLFGLDVLDELLLNECHASNDKTIFTQETVFG